MLLAMATAPALAQDTAAPAATPSPTPNVELIEGPPLEPGKDYYAILETSKGRIDIKLYPDVAPVTVRNFVNLAEGTKPWRNPKNNRTLRQPFYNGLTFHRVIPNFMIQGGCPMGNGMGGPGYKFKDETTPEVTFEKEYVLAMANSGPGTNGSQFFITDKGSKPTYLNGRHTIFGEVVAGREVVDAIANVPRGSNDRPNEPVIIKSVTVVRLNAGEEYKAPSAPAAEATPDVAPSGS
jgi:peptidyl-prolyl cis-trans isomerase A (cyclophilin A)